MKQYLFPLLLVTMTTLVQAAEHQIKPGESPQNALDRAAPGDKLILLPGLHQHKLGKHRSILTIQYTWTLNPNGSGYLLGHPSFRSRLSNVRCNYNYMETAVTSIEPNFNLDQYEVVGNVIKSGGQAIHCWRHSTGGLVADNLRVHDNTGKPVVVLGAPAGWEQPQPPILRNNRDHLSSDR